MFGSCSATTWPGLSPAPRSPAAQRPDSSSSSRYVVVVPAIRQAGASGAARVASVRMVERLKLIPAPIAVLVEEARVMPWPAVVADRAATARAILVSETYIKCVSLPCLALAATEGTAMYLV